MTDRHGVNRTLDDNGRAKKGGKITRPTVADVVNNVPGARDVDPDYLPRSVRYLANAGNDTGPGPGDMFKCEQIGIGVRDSETGYA